ncbi:hypothetical protein DV737_g4871, partial [Chaetothyriales sp. CBS 132003]
MDIMTRSKSDEVAARVDDYLDDQIQTATDLGRVGGLLARVQEQQDALKKQLQEAQNALSEAQRNAEAQAEALRLRVDQFQKQQGDLDARIQDITGSTTNNDAVKAFESRMIKVRRLEIATSYLHLLQEVDNLSTEARKTIVTQPSDALARYLKLQSLTRGLQQAQPAAEGASPHLIDHVEQITLKLKEDISAGLVKTFQATLEKMNWPKKELNLPGPTLSAWGEQASLLLKLGEQDLMAQQIIYGDDQSRPARVLLPLEVMVQPIAQRFRYHFFGDKATNRLDKPEYFLSHILDLVDRHSNFVINAFQPLLDARCQVVSELELVYSDAVSEFITALLPLALTKCLSVLPQLSSHPQLLSHLIHEVMLFDNSLRETWAYAPSPSPASEWNGLSGEILTTHGYFNTWMSVEKEFALARYRTIRDDPESADIDYDGVEANESKPTNGAIRINNLLETITDRYRGLSSFSQKMKFLIGVQLSIFDDYHQYLHGALQAYLASSHTAGRLLQGQSKSEALGEKGLASLCKIYGSAEFLERKMEDWGDDIFFLELWEELEDRAKANSGSSGTVGQDLTVDAVAAKTSSTIKQNGDEELETEGGALFDETATSYRRLKELAEAEVLRLLDINVRDAVQPLAGVETWASLSAPVADMSALAPSSAVDSLLQTISSLLGFLRRVMAVSPLRKAAKHFCNTLQHEILSVVVLRHSFSTAGVAQLKRDVLALATAIDGTTGARGVAAASMRKLDQATYLLGLPIKASATASEAQNAVDDGWGFDNEDDNNDDTNPTEAAAESEEEKQWGLWEVEKGLFKSNEAARQTLAEMGLDLLSENEARNVLKRRVEIGS